MNGLKLEQPYLRPGSVDLFQVADAGGRRLLTASSSDAWFLEVAHCIGRRLCRDALWADRRCNWLGWSLERNRHYWTPTFRAQGVTLYDGTAGIALFLSWLVRFTGDPLARATLAGALNRLERSLTDRVSALPPGFYHESRRHCRHVCRSRGGVR